MRYLSNIWIVCKRMRYIDSGKQRHRFQQAWSMDSLIFYLFFFSIFGVFPSSCSGLSHSLTFFLFLCIADIDRCSEHARDVTRNLKCVYCLIEDRFDFYDKREGRQACRTLLSRKKRQANYPCIQVTCCTHAWYKFALNLSLKIQ